VLSDPLKLGNPLVVDSGKDLHSDFFADPADLGKNLFHKARCESGHLALQVTKQEEIAECTIWRIIRMGDSVDFGSGNLISRRFGNVDRCIIEMQINASKRPSAIAAAEVPLDIRKNKYAKELCVIPHPGKQCKKTMDAGPPPSYVHQPFLLSIIFHARVGRIFLDGAQAESCEYS
jgi:hypothetical protein